MRHRAEARNAAAGEHDMTIRFRHILEPRAVLGEAPVWDPVSRRLHWVDCDQKKLFRLDARTQAVDRIDLPHYPGSYAFVRGGGMVMAYRNQLVLLDADLAPIQAIETGADFSRERFNDGACDRRGRFWIGTMDRRLKEPVGHLFRVDPDLRATCMVSDLIASNGIAFSPDDKVMYHTDTGAMRIYAYDFDFASGSIANRRVFADFTGQRGRPDGCAIDSEGHLWVAEIGAGLIVRIDPMGARVQTAEVATPRPTSVAFGGGSLRTLYVTSMQHGLTPEQLAAEPLAGCLFFAEVEVAGLPEPYFGGQPLSAGHQFEQHGKS